MIVGCYSMDLYCDADGHRDTRYDLVGARTTYTGSTFSGCKRQAVEDGWKFRKENTVVCPTCAEVRG